MEKEKVSFVYQVNPRDYILHSLLKIRNPTLSEEAYLTLPKEIVRTQAFWVIYPKRKSVEDLSSIEAEKWEKFLSYYGLV